MNNFEIFSIFIDILFIFLIIKSIFITKTQKIYKYKSRESNNYAALTEFVNSVKYLKRDDYKIYVDHVKNANIYYYYQKIDTKGEENSRNSIDETN